MIDITGLREDKRPQSSTIVHALLDRLEAAEKERDALRAEVIHIKEVEFPRKAQAVADGWRGKLEAAEKERDALRSLVVMRFDHDHPPQFVQGYDPHELNEPVTAEHCRWFVAEIEQLRAKIEQMEQQEPVAKVTRNAAGQIRLEDAQGNAFDLFENLGATLCALPGTKGEKK